MMKLSKIYVPIVTAVIAIMIVGYYYIEQLNHYNHNSFKLENTYHLLFELNTIEKNILKKEKIVQTSLHNPTEKTKSEQEFKAINSKLSFLSIDTLLTKQNRTLPAVDTLKSLVNTTLELFRTQLENNTPQTTDKVNYYIEKVQQVVQHLSTSLKQEVKTLHIQKRQFEKNRRGTEAVLTIVIVAFFMVAVYYLQKFLSENTKFQRELRNKNYDLKILNKEILDLHFANAHNLQEPMRKIQMLIDLSKQQNKDLSLTFDRIKSISAEQQLTNKNILRYYEVLNRTLKLEVINLNSFFQHYVTTNQLNQKLILNIEELPEIKGDLMQITQLFDEIIQNTLDFNRNQHDLSLTIAQVEISKNDIREKYNVDLTQHYVTISIEDNGSGIPQEYYVKIFELFQKINQGKSFENKKGMGLSFCKRIMLNHKGIIVAENSTKGTGLKLMLFFPKV